MSVANTLSEVANERKRAIDQTPPPPGLPRWFNGVYASRTGGTDAAGVAQEAVEPPG